MTPPSGTTPVSSVFPAAQLGPFLRAMIDPEGRGLSDADERVVNHVEQRMKEVDRG